MNREPLRILGRLMERMASAASLGSSVMFISIVLGLRGSTLFSPDTKDNHPRILFPLYYTFEFVLLGLGLAGGLLAWWATSPQMARDGRSNRRIAPAIGLTIALVLVLADYLWLYRPLAEMLGHPPYPVHFRQLHEWSRWVNAGVLLITLVAALQAQWPRGDD